MNAALHPLAPATWMAMLAVALSLRVLGQEARPAASPAAPASPAQAADATPDAGDASEEEDAGEEEAPATNAGATNAAPSLNDAGSTHPPATNAPPRRASRRSSRRPERSGIADWRPSGRSTSSASTNGPAKSDYAYFQLVNDRNIFNPARVPNRPDRPRSTEARRTPRVESLSLVGTLRYEKGMLAFFDGTSSDFRKALKPGDAIGGHRILSVTDSVVRLVVKDAPVDLKVGHQLRREDEGEWTLAEGVTLAATATASSGPSSSSSSSSPSTPSTAASSGSSGGGAEEILRRLRERRAQETKQ